MTIRSFSLALASAVVLGCAPAWAVEITHDLGVTEVPDDPQRIVVLEFSFLDSLVAVGVAPVGITDDGDRAMIVPAYTDVIGNDWTSVGRRPEPNIEVIASLQPDLIIADTNRHGAIYEALSEIAPTIAFDSYTGTYEVALDAARIIGHAIGKDAEMEARLAEHAVRMEAYRAEIGDVADISIQFLIDNGEAIYLHAPNSYNGTLLSYLGFTSTMPIPAGNGAADVIVQSSLEQLSEINPDVILRGKYTDPGLTDSWVGQPLWDNLGAVSNSNVMDVNAHEWSRLRGLVASEVSAANIVDLVKQISR